MRILVRLPNWLGDMVMSAGALQQLSHFYPDASISVIVKKGLQDLLPFFPPTEHRFVFSKEEYKGLPGLWSFGRLIRKTATFDLFVSFPNSFSSALMGYATGAKTRIGYRNEARQLLLTKSYQKPSGFHRVEEYVALLENYTDMKANSVSVCLQHSFPKKDHLVININSEASSRRLTTTKAVEIINAVRKSTTQKIVLIGGAREKAFVNQVLGLLPDPTNIQSVAGETSLPELATLLASAAAVLTTDSGPAHLANALGTQTVVLFGAGNEANTSPYNQSKVQVIRLGELSCEPCTKNVCVRYGIPQCLERLQTAGIVSALHQRNNYES